MADWGNVQQGMATGFQIGQKAGGKLSGLGVALKNVANQMVKKRETGEALGTLGQTERIKQEIGLEYDPEKRLKREIFSKKERGEELTPEEKKLGYGYTEEATTQSIVDKEGNVVGQRPTGSVFQPKEDPFNKYFLVGIKNLLYLLVKNLCLNLLFLNILMLFKRTEFGKL